MKLILNKQKISFHDNNKPVSVLFNNISLSHRITPIKLKKYNDFWIASFYFKEPLEKDEGYCGIIFDGVIE